MHHAFLALFLSLSKEYVDQIDIANLHKTDVKIEKIITQKITDSDITPEISIELAPEVLPDITQTEFMSDDVPEIANIEVDIEIDTKETEVEEKKEKDLEEIQKEKEGELKDPPKIEAIEDKKIVDKILDLGKEIKKDVKELITFDKKDEQTKEIKLKSEKEIIKEKKPAVPTRKEKDSTLEIMEEQVVSSQLASTEKTEDIISKIKAKDLTSNKEVSTQIEKIQIVNDANTIDKIVKKIDTSLETEIIIEKSPQKSEQEKEMEQLDNSADAVAEAKDYIEDENYEYYLTEDEKLDLQLDIEEDEEINRKIVPYKKVKHDFKNTNIPQELLAQKRELDNRHIPQVITYGQFKHIAQKAIEDDDLAVFRSVVQELGDYDLVLNNTSTGLCYATALARHDIMSFLIYNGANVNLKNKNLKSPLHIAVNSGSLKSVKILLERSANINTADILHRTPLMLAIEEDYTEIAILLIRNNADIDLINRRGERAMDLAKKLDRKIIIRALSNIKE